MSDLYIKNFGPSLCIAWSWSSWLSKAKARLYKTVIKLVRHIPLLNSPLSLKEKNHIVLQGILGECATPWINQPIQQNDPLIPITWRFSSFFWCFVQWVLACKVYLLWILETFFRPLRQNQFSSSCSTRTRFAVWHQYHRRQDQSKINQSDKRF